MRILFDAYQYDTDEMQIKSLHRFADHKISWTGYFISFNIILIFKLFKEADIVWKIKKNIIRCVALWSADPENASNCEIFLKISNNGKTNFKFNETTNSNEPSPKLRAFLSWDPLDLIVYPRYKFHKMTSEASISLFRSISYFRDIFEFCVIFILFRVFIS